MPRWNTGSAIIERLLDAIQLQRVPADSRTVESRSGTPCGQRLLRCGRRSRGRVRARIRRFPQGSDGAASAPRPRPTTAGGHLSVVEAVNAQFPNLAGLSSLDRLRRRRNQAEYPDPASYDPVTTSEAEEAFETAEACIDTARKLLAVDRLGVV